MIIKKITVQTENKSMNKEKKITENGQFPRKVKSSLER
jgi:hypothetical protein